MVGPAGRGLEAPDAARHNGRGSPHTRSLAMAPDTALVTLFQAALLLAAFLCSLVAGFLFAFAVVVMPGLKRLDDGGFIRAFQVIDRVIQHNQPLFVLVWVGSVLSIIAAAGLGLRAATGLERVVLVAAALVYVLAVQLPTMAINIPLNNQLQRHDVAAMTEAARARARESFEARWNRWNAIRTAAAAVVTAALLAVLLPI